MSLVYFLKVFFATVCLLVLFIFAVDRFIMVGKSYTGTKTKHFKDGVFTIGATMASDKTLFSVLKWQVGDRTNVPWDKTYGTDTITLTPLTAEKMRATFINHATVLIETPHYTFITDPIFTKRASPFSFMGPARHHDPYVALATIPKLDYVLISHNHYDHLSVDTLKEIEKRFHPVYIVPLNNGQFIKKAGVPEERIVELDVSETYETPTHDLTIALEEARHWSARGLSDRKRYLWGSYVIATENQRLYFAGDTGYGPHFAATREKYRQIDIALLPIGAYEPRWFMKAHHMNPEEALQAAHDLGDPAVMAIHFGTFKLTDEGRGDPEKAMKATLSAHPYPSNFLIPTMKNGLQLEAQ